MRRKKEGCFISFLVILLLTGLFLTMFPIVWGAAMDKTISENAQQFLNREETAESADSYVSESQAEESIPYAELWEDMTAYNIIFLTRRFQNTPGLFSPTPCFYKGS